HRFPLRRSKNDGCRLNHTGCRHTRQPVTLEAVIAIQALLTENELADDFVASFRARRLAERFFYWFPLSVRAWLALCSDGAYRNFVRSRSLIAQSADDLARLVHPGPLEVMSLGSGQGDKDLLQIGRASCRGRGQD